MLNGIDPSDYGLATAFPLGDTDGIKVLGIKWNPKSDAFEFDVTTQPIQLITKRITVSMLAKLFDPLG